MRFPYQTPQDRRPLVEAGDRAATIRRTAAVMATPCPTATRSARMTARWNQFLAAQAVTAVTR